MLNNLDRYHVAAQAVRAGAAKAAEKLAAVYERKRQEVKAHAERHGEDPPEIHQWTWTPRLLGKEPGHK